jgi:hypothetical protein
MIEGEDPSIIDTMLHELVELFARTLARHG